VRESDEGNKPNEKRSRARSRIELAETLFLSLARRLHFPVDRSSAVSLLRASRRQQVSLRCSASFERASVASRSEESWRSRSLLSLDAVVVSGVLRFGGRVARLGMSRFPFDVGLKGGGGW